MEIRWERADTVDANVGGSQPITSSRGDGLVALAEQDVQDDRTARGPEVASHTASGGNQAFSYY
jgi:hypothetical protein